jgi:hypothetical protein
MQLRLSKIFLLLLILNGLSNWLQAQAKFTAKLSAAVIGKDETVELRLVVGNAGLVKNITLPSLKNFNIVRGPIEESGFTEDVNGTAIRYIGITFILSPKAKGEFVIAPASAEANGKILHSNAVKIKITNALQPPPQAMSSSPFNNMMGFDKPSEEATYNDFIVKKGENLNDKINKNIFIKVVTDKTSCFVGEPIVVTYKLFTRLKSESNITKSPSFNDFSVIDLIPVGSNAYTVEKLDGRSYNVYILRKAQLYPLQAGALTLESAEVENNIRFVKEDYVKQSGKSTSELFDFLMLPSTPSEAVLDEKIILQSKPVLVQIKPLPEKDKAPTFAGAVGNFTLDATLEKNAFTTEDAGKLIITISGQGNFTIVNAPEIVWPKGIESFEPRAEEELNKVSVPVSGTKIFTYPFSISKEGVYTLPAIEFSFFDLARGQYKTLSIKPLQVKVIKGNGIKSTLVVENKTGQEKFSDTIFTHRWMIIAPVALFIFIGLFVWLSKENKKENDHASAQVKEAAIINEDHIEPIVQNPLAGAEEKLILQDNKGFYETINRELKFFISKELQLMPENFNKKNIEETMDKKGLPLLITQQTVQVLDEIEWELYAPYAGENKMQEVFEKAIAVVALIKCV